MKLLLYITLTCFFIFQSKAVISQSSDSIPFEQISQFIQLNEYQQALSIINQIKQINDPIKKIRLLKYSAECHEALKISPPHKLKYPLGPFGCTERQRHTKQSVVFLQQGSQHEQAQHLRPSRRVIIGYPG